MKIAILTDTNSSITKEKAAELGVHVLAMPFSIENSDFYEGETLKKAEFYNALNSDKDIKTSQVSPGDTMKKWDELLKTHEQIIHIPMSSALSNTYQTTKMLSLEEKYASKVFVVDNKRISVTLLESVLNAKMMVDKGLTSSEILALLELDSANCEIYVTVETLKFLKKGGRITPVAAALGTALSIKPILKLTDGKLDSYKKARGLVSAKKEMISAVKAKLAEWPDSNIYVAYSGDDSVGEEWLKVVKSEFPEYNVSAYHLPLSIVCHTGSNALGVGLVKKFK